jgi:hypothetical protein
MQKIMIDYLLFYVSLKNLMETSADEALQNLGLCSALRAFEQGGIVLMKMR